MRTFIALEIPEGLSAEMAALARVLSEHVKGRAMKHDSYHLTLAFIGDLEPARIDAACAALERACENTAPILLTPTEIGKFGKSHDATLWLGLRPDEKLMTLAEHVRDELARENIGFDTKAFKPHITLMRRAAIPRGPLPALPFPNPATANTVTLFKSQLDKSGATYTELHRCFLTT